jgi:hypothetical protein
LDFDDGAKMATDVGHEVDAIANLEVRLWPHAISRIGADLVQGGLTA